MSAIATDTVVKCQQFKMPMRVSHCITKCGYAIKGNKPCSDIANAIDDLDAVLIPAIAALTCSSPFARAFAVDVERARQYTLTGVIPAKTKSPKPEKVQEPTPAPEPALAPEKENEMSEVAPPAPPAAPAVVAPAPQAAPAASAPTPAPAEPAPPAAPEAPRRGRTKAVVPKTEKETPMPRGIPNDPSKPRRAKAAATPADPAKMLVLVESRSGSGKFVISDGDIAKMLSLKAAGRRVLVVMQSHEL